MFKRGQITLNMAKQALESYHCIPIGFVDVSLEKSLDIAHDHNIYAYDAYLLQCARQTGTSLLTLDRKLKSVAVKLGIAIMEPES